MRLVFMGTPSFVVPVLGALADSRDVSVVGVFTPPDRPRGRGRSPEMPPVKAGALDRGLEVYQPASLRTFRVHAELKSLEPDVIVVAAYGKILPPQVLATPRRGCLNQYVPHRRRLRGPRDHGPAAGGGGRLAKRGVSAAAAHDVNRFDPAP